MGLRLPASSIVVMFGICGLLYRWFRKVGWL